MVVVISHFPQRLFSCIEEFLGNRFLPDDHVMPPGLRFSEVVRLPAQR